MGEFRILSAQIVGEAIDGGWAQSYREDPFYLTLALGGQEKNQALGKEILGEFLAEFAQPKTKNLAQLCRIVAQIKPKVEAGQNFSGAVGIVQDKVFYGVSWGGGRIFLKRGNRWGEICGGDSSASGFVQPGDSVVLGTGTFWEIVSPQDIKENLTEPAELAEKIAPLLHQDKDSSQAAALVLSFLKKEDEEEKEKQQSFVKPLTHFLARFPKILPSRNFSLASPEKRTKRTLMTVGLVLIFLLLVSIFFGVEKRQQEEKNRVFTGSYQLILEKYEEGKGLLDLNRPLAQKALLEAKEITEETKVKFKNPKSKEAKKLGELEQKIQELLVLASGIQKLPQPTPFLDLNLIKEGAEGTRLALYKKTLAVLDKKNGTAYTILLSQKASQIVGGNFKEAKLVAIHGERVYVFGQEGIFQIETKSKKSELIIKREDDWGEIGALVAYAGNLYLLDKGNPPAGGQIWKYMRTDSGFSERKNYLAKDLTPNFSQGSGMAIDGAVWVASGKNILRYILGKSEFFALKGRDQEITRLQAVFTDEESENLYLLDREGQKIAVFTKKGDYVAQYQGEWLANAQDLVVLESEKKILVLSGSKIYAIEVK